MPSTNQLFVFLATAAVVYTLAYRRGVIAGTAQANTGPTIGGGIDWLAWQAQ